MRANTAGLMAGIQGSSLVGNKYHHCQFLNSFPFLIFYPKKNIDNELLLINPLVMIVTFFLKERLNL